MRLSSEHKRSDLLVEPTTTANRKLEYSDNLLYFIADECVFEHSRRRQNQVQDYFLG